MKLTKKIIAETYEAVAHTVANIDLTKKKYVEYVIENKTAVEDRMQHYSKIDASSIIMSDPDASDAEREEAKLRLMASYAIEDMFRAGTLNRFARR